MYIYIYSIYIGGWGESNWEIVSFRIVRAWAWCCVGGSTRLNGTNQRDLLLPRVVCSLMFFRPLVRPSVRSSTCQSTSSLLSSLVLQTVIHLVRNFVWSWILWFVGLLVRRAKLRLFSFMQTYGICWAKLDAERWLRRVTSKSDSEGSRHTYGRGKGEPS